MFNRSLKSLQGSMLQFYVQFPEGFSSFFGDANFKSGDVVGVEQALLLNDRYDQPRPHKLANTGKISEVIDGHYNRENVRVLLNNSNLVLYNCQYVLANICYEICFEYRSE